MSNLLESLLVRIRDGDVGAGDVEQARALLATDVRLPPELREGGLDEDVEDSAAALLFVLGLDEGLGLAGAVAVEAGPLDVTRRVLDGCALAEPDLPVSEAVRHEGGVDPVGVPLEAPVREALREEAGTLDVADAVMAMLGLDESFDQPLFPLLDALEEEAGEVDLADDILAAITGPRAAAEPPALHAIEDDETVEIDAEEPFEVPLAAAVRAEAGTVDVAAAVLAALGHEVLPLAAAVRAEAGTVDVAAAVMAEVGEEVVPLAAAVRAEAGTVDVTEEVALLLDPAWASALLDGALRPGLRAVAAARLRTRRDASLEMTVFADLGRELRSQLQAEAGEPPSVWADVARAIGIEAPEEVVGYDGQALAAAVREEAGSVDVVDAVMQEIRRRPVAPVVEIPEAANTGGFTWGAVVLAAVALFAVLLGRFVPMEPLDVQQAEPESALHFASSDEIVVDDLSYAEDAQVTVIRGEGEEGTLIIWVDEEAVL